MGYVAPILEAKYRAIQEYIDSNPGHNVLQLGCALLTHGLFVPKNVKYLGLDLPAMIESRRKIFADAGVQYPPGYRDEACNVFDKDKLEGLVRDYLPMDKPILVVHESLLYHFSIDRKKRLIETLASLGRDYGIKWANTDMLMRSAIEKRIKISPVTAKIMEVLTGNTGRDLINNCYPSIDVAARVLTEHGFDFDSNKDIHPLYTEGDFQINTLPTESGERQRVLTMLSNLKTWMSRFKSE